ncbi:MFS transporter [Streptomyces antioxidans]|uniref:MFS transporter n=1 Tax=Streptomyces antioxidans TaxID=1507734 RepID=A0A1V4CYH2_9ACTN|nr:MFS transporter [Streptomyces antioxidans]OPF73159.1 MFS transporter [Streptomyces antioxidans]
MAGRVLFVTIGLIYFTVSVGIPAVQVGAVLTFAGGISIVVGVPVARLSDLFGSRPVLVAAMLGQSLGTAAYVVAKNLIAYATITIVVTVCGRAAHAAKGAVMGAVLVGEERTVNRSRIRSWSNAAAVLAAGSGAWVLHVNEHWAYLVAIGCSASIFLFAAYVSALLPHTSRPERPADASRLGVLRDRPFIALTVIDALFTLQMGLLEILPLWVAEHTGAPRWMGGVLFGLNTVMVVFLQARASRGVTDLGSAGIANRRAGVLLFGACVLFGLAGQYVSLAAFLLVGAALVFVWGEMLHAAAGWELSFGLAPEGEHAQYQAMFGTGTTVGLTAAPLVSTALVLGTGTAGWVIVGAVFLCAGTATPWVVRWALQQRPGHMSPVSVG